MVVRNGRYGAFYACKNYPKCRFTKQKTVNIGINCPKCSSPIVGKHAKENVLFYSCSAYPECDFSSWDRPIEEKCPECAEMLFIRKAVSWCFAKQKAAAIKERKS
jgi:DNA topoisomerase-1